MEDKEAGKPGGKPCRPKNQHVPGVRRAELRLSTKTSGFSPPGRSSDQSQLDLSRPGSSGGLAAELARYVCATFEFGLESTRVSAFLLFVLRFRWYEQSIKDLCSSVWLRTQIAWFLEPLILDILEQPIPKQDHGLLVECAAGGDQWNHR